MPQSTTELASRRRRLPDRRSSETFDIESQGLQFTVSASRFADGALAEIFITNDKAGSMAGTNAADAAVVCSIALQHGVPLDTIRRALMRDSKSTALGPLGTALDKLGAAP
jgi:hypothetical protein